MKALANSTPFQNPFQFPMEISKDENNDLEDM